MHMLSHLSESSLLEKTSALAKEERRISVEVLQHLREIERRRAFAHLGYRSLFEYAIGELKYSEASAMRRIQASRALKDLPGLAEKIETGSLSVTQVARVQSFVRKDEKLSGTKWVPEKKKELFAKAERSSARDLEQVLVEISPKAAVIETSKPVAGGLTEVKIYLSGEEIKELNELRALLAHQLKDPGSNSELIRKLVKISKEVVVRKKTGGSQRNASPLRSRGVIEKQSDQVEKSPFVQTRFIPAAIKRQVFKRAGLQCEYVDSKTGVRCQSKFKLEMDHRVPYALGGVNDLKNLRLVCRGHNANRTRLL